MDNPKAAKDILENPESVYGYSPNPNSESIGGYADAIDWTNSTEVAEATNHQRNLNRLEDYVNDADGLAREKNRNISKYGNANGPTAEFLFEKYDDEHFVVLLKRNSKNLFMDFGLCNFESEMEYWDMPTKLIDFMGEKTFLFSNEIDKSELKDEIERFIAHNEI